MRGGWEFPALAGVIVGATGYALLSQTPPATSTPTFAKQQTERVQPFRNCAEARAAGHAPVYEGDPRYAPWLDRDNDGIGCEPYYGPR